MTQSLSKTVTETLTTEKNPSTGNTFYHVADSEDFTGFIRFWKENSTPDHTVIAFRFRLTPKIEMVNVGHYALAKWPGLKYTGGGTSHLSVAGLSAFKVPATDFDHILKLVEDNDIGGKIYDKTVETFTGMDFLLSREEFIRFYKEQLDANLYVPSPKEDPSKPTGVVLEFSSFKAKYDAGKQVIEADEPPDVGL